MLQEAGQDREPEGAELERQCADAVQTAAVLNQCTEHWHQEAPVPQGLVLQLHLANFELWHLEDQARDIHSGDAAVARTKRAIDRVNQRRNDTAERIDATLIQTLSSRGLPSSTAPLHSETPGQMLDRLSILALKIYHTAVEGRRADATAEHQQRSLDRLHCLQQQQNDLADCLTVLWSGILTGQRRFKLYRQLKMYNDPSLNPVLYGAPKTR